MYADVLVNVSGLNKTFTYKVSDDALIGMRVRVPFGNRVLEGFILKTYKNVNTEFEIKEVNEVIDKYPVINEEMLDLGKYISKKTLSPLITCYQAMLPTALKAKKTSVNKKYVTILKIIFEFVLEYYYGQIKKLYIGISVFIYRLLYVYWRADYIQNNVRAISIFYNISNFYIYNNDSGVSNCRDYHLFYYRVAY